MGGQGAGGKPDFAQGGAPDGAKAADGVAAVEPRWPARLSTVRRSGIEDFTAEDAEEARRTQRLRVLCVLGGSIKTPGR